MIERLYIALWGIYLIAIALFLATGMLNALTGVVFGFILFGLVFMGMISVLPHWATHQDRFNH
ncbi:MAG: hypothetical protein HKN25_02665 [Pyrinomonadaceae bacterium]|nr:hypothetical protein [Pyrinomonadaceae bacterium]